MKEKLVVRGGMLCYKTWNVAIDLRTRWQMEAGRTQKETASEDWKITEKFHCRLEKDPSYVMVETLAKLSPVAINELVGVDKEISMYNVESVNSCFSHTW